MNQVESPFYFFISEKLSLSLAPTRKENGINGEVIIARPINNHLKTPEEMEADFKKYDEPAQFRRQLQQDGYINIHKLDEALSRCMEENY